jgi:integrase
MSWGLDQEVMRVKASAADDVTRAGHLISHFGNLKAVQITPLMVDNFRVKMKRTISKSTGRAYSGTTINKMITLARRIYYLGMDAGIVSRNPFARRGMFKEEPQGRYIPDGEFWKLFGFLPEYLKPATLTAYLTGMRRGEILDLTWERVDLFKGYIDLTPADTKTGEPRHIYLNTMPELKRVFVESARRKKSGQKLVFTKPDGSPLPKHYMDRLFKRACKKAKVGPYRFHDLRHTFNTNMVKAGVDRAVIMRLTGHKTLAMFLRYSHLDREQSEAAMEKLGGLLTRRKDQADALGHTTPKKEEQEK